MDLDKHMNKDKILEKLEQIKKGQRESCIFGAGTVGKNFGLELLKKELNVWT